MPGDPLRGLLDTAPMRCASTTPCAGSTQRLQAGIRGVKDVPPCPHRFIPARPSNITSEGKRLSRAASGPAAGCGPRRGRAAPAGPAEGPTEAPTPAAAACPGPASLSGAAAQPSPAPPPPPSRPPQAETTEAIAASASPSPLAPPPVAPQGLDPGGLGRPPRPAQYPQDVVALGAAARDLQALRGPHGGRGPLPSQGGARGRGTHSSLAPRQARQQGARGMPGAAGRSCALPPQRPLVAERTLPPARGRGRGAPGRSVTALLAG